MGKLSHVMEYFFHLVTLVTLLSFLNLTPVLIAARIMFLCHGLATFFPVHECHVFVSHKSHKEMVELDGGCKKCRTLTPGFASCILHVVWFQNVFAVAN